MTDKLLIVANWKANKAVPEAKEWVEQLAASCRWLGKTHPALEIALAVPYTLLYFLQEKLAANPLPLTATLAAQDVSSYPIGQYTGTIPAKLLADVGVTYCLLGHSERRKFLAETNTDVEAKLKQCLENALTPIICAQTLEEIPANIRNYPAPKLYVMYEPGNAISTNGVYHADSPENIEATLTDWQAKLPVGINFLYGGSVNPNNVKLITNNLITNNSVLNFSGFVVGHASLVPSEFLDIIKECLVVL